VVESLLLRPLQPPPAPEEGLSLWDFRGWGSKSRSLGAVQRPTPRGLKASIEPPDSQRLCCA